MCVIPFLKPYPPTTNRSGRSSLLSWGHLLPCVNDLPLAAPKNGQDRYWVDAFDSLAARIDNVHNVAHLLQYGICLPLLMAHLKLQTGAHIQTCIYTHAYTVPHCFQHISGWNHQSENFGKGNSQIPKLAAYMATCVNIPGMVDKSLWWNCTFVGSSHFSQWLLNAASTSPSPEAQNREKPPRALLIVAVANAETGWDGIGSHMVTPKRMT